MLFSLFFSILFFLLSVGMQLTVSGLAISWNNSNFVAVSHPFPFSIAFSISIIITIVQIFIFIMLTFYSRSHGFLWTWLALIISNFALSITLVSPLSLDAWIDEWDAKWTNTSHTMSFQYESTCCGWNDFKDRAITDCPFDYQSGCKDIVTRWIRNKFDQLFMSLLLSAAIIIYPVMTIYYFFF